RPVRTPIEGLRAWVPVGTASVTVAVVGKAGAGRLRVTVTHCPPGTVSASEGSARTYSPPLPSVAVMPHPTVVSSGAFTSTERAYTAPGSRATPGHGSSPVSRLGPTSGAIWLGASLYCQDIRHSKLPQRGH